MIVSTKLYAIFSVAALGLFPALANASLESRMQVYDAAPAVPDANLVLTFPTDVDLSGTDIELLDSHMQEIPIDKLEFSGSKSDISVPLREPLIPGAYTVNWKARAVDGRESHGSYSFNVGN